MKLHAPTPLVLCEGKEDRLVMEALASHSGIGDRLRFEEYGGTDKLRPYLSNLKVRHDYRSGEVSKILVTRDADASHDKAWAAAIGAITAAFSLSPSRPGEWVSIPDGPAISAWIIPGQGKAGMIETLYLEAAKGRSPEIFGCLETFVKCLAHVHGEAPHEKARFALWTIAARPRTQDRLSVERAMPNLPVDWNHAAFEPLRDLLFSLVHPA